MSHNKRGQIFIDLINTKENFTSVCKIHILDVAKMQQVKQTISKRGHIFLVRQKRTKINKRGKLRSRGLHQGYERTKQFFKVLFFKKFLINF